MVIKILNGITVVLLVIVVCSPASLCAANLGTIGEVYPIQEMDIVDFIQVRLHKMQQTGEVEKINMQITESIKKLSQRLPPVKGLSPAKVYRTWYIYPSVFFARDIEDAAGRVIIEAGTVVNPLSHISRQRSYIFYDGDNKEQVAWLSKKCSARSCSGKLILVNGSVVEQSNVLKKRVYFDQYGKIIDKFKIKHTPAVVTQQEDIMFKVEEFAL